MKKMYLLIVIVMLIVIGCSNPEERIKIAKIFGGELIYQSKPDEPVMTELFITSDGSNLFVFYANDEYITPKYKCKIEDFKKILDNIQTMNNK